MNNFLDKLFFVVYSIYTKWKDFDAFFHTAVVIGVLFASSITFLSLLLYNITGIKIFYLETQTIFILWFAVIGIFIIHYYRRKEILIKFHSENKLNREFLGYYVLLVLMFSTWFINPFLT